MKDNCQKHLEKAHDLAEQLFVLADPGNAERQDVGCGIVFGTLRDGGYKLRMLVAREIENHQQKESLGKDEDCIQ